MSISLPFDPIQRSREVEQIVMLGVKRLYYRFRFAKFYGGIVTADAVGCNLLCAYCWNYSRNLNPAKAGTLYSPSEVAEKLKSIAARHRCNQFRVSGAEPILGRASATHLAEIVRLVGGHFIVETNGIMLGYDPSLAKLLEPLSVYVRLTIKGHEPESYQKITGASGESLKYQLQASEVLREAKINHSIAAMVPFVDPGRLPCRVGEIEELILYKSIEKNMIQRGFDLDL